MTTRIIGIGIAAFGLIVTGGFVGGTINTAQDPIIAVIAFLGLAAMVFTGLSYVFDRVQTITQSKTTEVDQ